MDGDHRCEHWADFPSRINSANTFFAMGFALNGEDDAYTNVARRMLEGRYLIKVTFLRVDNSAG